MDELGKKSRLGELGEGDMNDNLVHPGKRSGDLDTGSKECQEVDVEQTPSICWTLLYVFSVTYLILVLLLHLKETQSSPFYR